MSEHLVERNTTLYDDLESVQIYAWVGSEEWMAETHISRINH
jgi:hypothetical protein